MTTVKVFHSGMTGAPTLNGVVGAMVGLLDACLVNGFGLGTVDSVVLAGGVGTVTRSAGHPFEPGAIGLLAGATVSGGTINGERRVLSTTVTTWTFDATGISNQTATGTITQKLAPAGWAKTYSGTNLAAYKSANVAATGCLLRVDDTNTTVARVVGYETMSDVNTGTGPFPTAGQISGGGYWPKSNTADSTVRPWVVVADDRGFYLAVSHGSSVGYSLQWFGDGLPNKSTDAYFAMLSSSPSAWVATAAGLHTQADMAHMDLASDSLLYACRGMSGLGASKQLRRSASTMIGNSFGFSGASNTWTGYPNSGDNGLYAVPMTVMEAAPTPCYRGVAPGLFFVPQFVGSATFALLERITGVTGLTGRSLMAIPNAQGCTLFDVTGPWR